MTSMTGIAQPQSDDQVLVLGDSEVTIATSENKVVATGQYHVRYESSVPEGSLMVLSLSTIIAVEVELAGARDVGDPTAQLQYSEDSGSNWSNAHTPGKQLPGLASGVTRRWIHAIQAVNITLTNSWDGKDVKLRLALDNPNTPTMTLYRARTIGEGVKL